MIRPNKRRRSACSAINKRRSLQLESLECRKLLAAEILQVTVENLSPVGGLAETPFWAAVHDGNFDIGNSGEAASGFGGLELIAEEGDASQLVARFAAESTGNDTVILAPGGFGGAPVFESGETVSENFTVDDTQASRYFSFASMVIPSNDAFVANLDPQAYEIFDSAGQFLGNRTIVIYGSNVYDAGTEVNDPTGGAAFSTGGGTSVDENGVITRHDGLDEFIGTGLPTSSNLASAFTDQTPLARITLSLASNPSGPIDNESPIATLDAPDLSTRAAFHEISVTYNDATGIDLSSIDTNDIVVTSPFLTQLDIIGVTTDAAPGTTPRTVTATYQVAPASGQFTEIDNGVYAVALAGGEVGDPFAQTAAAASLGEFAVDAPVRLQVTIESLGPDGGLNQTPFWIAAHNGEFEVARAGVAATDFAGLEDIAEEGIIGPLATRFSSDSEGNDAVVTSPAGFGPAPVFESGETATQFLDVTDPTLSRYFSYASMIIPSNDAFIANLDPRRFELFDSLGNFTGARSITVYGQDIWDAGTEANNPVGGAAFSTEGGTSVDENGVVHRHEGLDDFIGTGLPTAANLLSAFEPMSPIARITISLADMPADPIDTRGAQATADATDVTIAGAATHSVTVTYSDPSGIDVDSIDVSDLHVVGAFTDPLQVVGVTTDAAAGTSPRIVTATYEVASVDGAFSTFDNGVYGINVVDGAVSDTFGNSTEGRNLGTFNVLVGVQLEVTIENLSPTDGLAQTPFWIGFHEGNFEVARTGLPAANFDGLELIAETGDASGLVAAFAAASDGVDSVVTAPDGFAGAPVFEPGEVSSQIVELFSTDANRYFSFASMIIPSNDAFIANLNPRAYELFDINGVFQGQRTITIYGNDVWDAGTEVNDPTGGAAFSTGGGTGVDESGLIHRHEGLDDFIGTGLPTGANLESAFAGSTPLARITINLAGATSSPIDESGPVASLESAEAVLTAGTTNHEIQVTYNDPAGLDLNRFGTDDLRVVGPLSQVLEVTDAVVDAPSGTTPTTATVTYTVTTEDGEFTARNNGRYSISVSPDAVGDTLAHGNAGQSVGEFFVNVGIRLQVQIESLADVGGLGQTPFWLGFHDGSFEVARAGTSAAGFGGLEELAETGSVDPLLARFAAEDVGLDTVITSPAGFGGAPVFEPGESVTQLIEVTDANLYQYFSYASMIIPSNDAFVANLDPRRFQLFDSNGNFQGARAITIAGNQVWDAGTEVNDPAGGAAFSTEGGTSVDENGVIRLHEGLDDFIGTGLPTSTTLDSALDGNTPLARITISLFDPEASACSNVIGACSVSSVGLHNTQLPFDVNNSGTVEPIDALAIINFVNRFGVSPSIAEEARALGFFFDVSQNESIEPLDALIVVNHLNRINNGLIAEPEADPSVDTAFASFGANGFDNDDDDEDETFLFEDLI